MTTGTTTAAVCSRCHRAQATRSRKTGDAALPAGWKRLGEATWCPECFEQSFATVCATLPVWSVRPREGEGTDAAWKRFRAALRASTRDAAGVLNWCLAEFYALDREPLGRTADGKVKLPKLPVLDHLYAVGRERWPQLDSQSLGSLLQRARAKYREVRWNVRVRLDARLPTWAAPAPLPVPAKDAKLARDAAGKTWLTVRVNGERFELRLARGREFYRQLRVIDAVLGGTARQGELVLREGARNKVMAGVVANVPKRPSVREGVLEVRTAADKLWSVAHDDWSWNLNEDQIKTLIFAHAARRQRLSEDTKFERRSPRVDRTDLEAVRGRMSARYNQRLADFCHKAARLLVNFAARQRVATIRYHDGPERFVSQFPWFKLRAAVETKAAELGITVEVVAASGENAAG